LATLAIVQLLFVALALVMGLGLCESDFRGLSHRKRDVAIA
jgi:hypothetical protein